MTNTSGFRRFDHEDDHEIGFHNVIIPIEDVWHEMAQDYRLFSHLELDPADVVKTAIAYAIAGTRTDDQPLVFSNPFARANAHMQAYHLIVNQAKYPDEVLEEGATHLDVHRLVDIIGKVSYRLTEALLLNVGSVPMQTRLHRFLGRDIILQIPTEVRRGHERNLARSNSRL